MSQARRLPITYPEFEHFAKTKEFPMLSAPVIPGNKPYCHNCKYWVRQNSHTGECLNAKAMEQAPFFELGKAIRMLTGVSAVCSEHEPINSTP